MADDDGVAVARAGTGLLSQKILSTEVVQEPVTEKIVKGTKKVTSSTSYITGSGQFIWPVPGYRDCSRWYGGSHKGVSWPCLTV